MFRTVLLLLLAITAWAYWPATAADFVIDDYVFIAQSLMVDRPWVAIWTHHFYEPTYFRPLGALSWWIATHFFGSDNYAAHSAINLIIHLANVALVAYLARGLTQRVAPALAAATLFALLPTALAAALWPSNRFDLLATFFLLCATLCSLRFLREGRPGMWIAAAAATLGACWSKELAFPIATAMAFAFLTPQPIAWQRRLALFALMGFTITFAFVWRHWLLPAPYAVAGIEWLPSLWRGANAWVQSAPALLTHATQHSGLSTVAAVLALVAIAWSALTAFLVPRKQSVVDWRMIICAALVIVASACVQWPLAAPFSQMLDGGVLGTVTYARFYYAPTATLAILVALLLAKGRLVRSLATTIVIGMTVIGMDTRSLAISFAQWVKAEITPMSRAAAKIVDGVSAESQAAPCVVVLLGTQSKHPWFRMFSDVTAKALSQRLASSANCHVLTESTPWLFISRENSALPDIRLKAIANDTRGTPKPDYAWGGVRYRYRTMPEDVRYLKNARFFAWQGDRFTEVTNEIVSGARSVKTHGWGF